MCNKLTKFPNTAKFCLKLRFPRREQTGSGAGCGRGPAPHGSARRSRLSEASRDLGPVPRAFVRSRESRALSLPRARRQDGESCGWAGGDGLGSGWDRDPAAVAARSHGETGLRSSGGWWGGAALSPRREEEVRGGRSAMAPGCAVPGAGAGFSWRSLPASLTAALPLPRSLPGSGRPGS